MTSTASKVAVAQLGIGNTGAEVTDWFRQQLLAALVDPMFNVPKAFETWVVDRVAVSGLNIPIGQVIGYNNDAIPAGAVLSYAGTTAPASFLTCDGSSLLRAAYVNLFSAIGTTYGAADADHFNIPDIRGRVLAGLGTHADVDALNDSDGLAVGSRRPKHKHTVVQPTIGITDPQHRHPYHSGTFSGSTYGPNAEGMTSTSYATASEGTDLAATGITAAASGGTVGPQTGAEPTDGPAYIVVNYIIKT